MKLYHVSGINKNKPEIDMRQSSKCDVTYVYFLMDAMQTYDEFHRMYNHSLVEQCSKEKGWSKEKIAAEAIFEYVRLTEFSASPSRLLYAYFTDSIQKAKTFNKVERNNNGDYFYFEADEDKIYYYDMDIFDQAVKELNETGFTEKSFEYIKSIARKYWLTSKEGNIEILYKGRPVLKNITALVKKEQI